MLEFKYQYKKFYDGSKIELSEYDKMFRKLMNTILDLRLIAPVVTEETTPVISFKKFNLDERKFETFSIRFNKKYNVFEFLYHDNNKPWQQYNTNIYNIENLINFCLPTTINELFSTIIPIIDDLKIKLDKEIDDWRKSLNSVNTEVPKNETTPSNI